MHLITKRTFLICSIWFCLITNLTAQVFDVGSNSGLAPVSMRGGGAIAGRDDAFFGMSAGPAFSSGQFASTDYRNAFSGYAEDGFYFSLLNGFQKFGNHVGLGLNWNRAQFGFQTNEFAVFYNEVLPQFSFESRVDGNWVLDAFTGALVFSMPHKIFDVDMRVGLGLGRVVRPEIILEGVDLNTGFLSYHWLQARSVQNDLMLSFGMNGRLHLTNNLDLLIQWDYQRMNATMEILNVYAFSIQEVNMLEQQFEFFTLGAGLGLRID